MIRRAFILALLLALACPSCGGGTLGTDVASDATTDTAIDVPDAPAPEARAETAADLAPDETQPPPSRCDQTGKAPQGSDPAITAPTGVATDGDRVYVTDPAGHAVLKYTDTLTFVQQWKGFGGDPTTGPFEPYGIAIDSTDIYVTDTHRDNGRVVKATALSGQFEKAWGDGEDGTPDLIQPLGIALDGETDTVYVADADSGTVYAFSTIGTLLRVVSQGKLKNPVSLAFANGQLLVADMEARAIVVLASGGEELTRLDFDGELSEPVGLAIDGDRVFVTDRKLSRLFRGTLQTTLLGWCGGYGTEPGQLKSPRGLVVLGGELFLADYGNKRLVKIHP